MTEIRAPMVGRVLEVLVQVGATVAQDEELVIVESMKMEIPVLAPQDGTIQGIHVTNGDTVEENELLVTLG